MIRIHRHFPVVILLVTLLLKISDAVAGMRVQPEEETEGLDTVLHNEKGYNL